MFAAAAVACALANTIDQLIVMRFFHGLAAAAASVVINALMRDIYPKEEFSSGDRSRCRTIKRTLVQGKKIISSLCQFLGVM